MADLSQDQIAFVQTYGPLAQDVASATGLDASVVLGQIAQETGWGKHVSSNNIFGISPTGPNGKQVVAAYPDVQTAANAYVQLIRSGYSRAAQQQSPEAQAKALAAGGFNPNPEYGAKIVALASTVRPLMQSSARPSDADMAARWGVGPNQPQTASAAPRPADADMEKAWGIQPQNDNAPSAAKGPEAAQPQGPAPVAAAPKPDYTGWDQPTPQAQLGMNYVQTRPGDATGPLSYQSVTNTLAPAPNTTYGYVLPLARDNATDQLRFAMPQAWRDLAQGAVDLAYGPQMGTVTPKGTAALATVAGQLTPSPAAGSGLAVAARGNPLAAEAPAAEAAAVPPQSNPLSSSNAPAFVPPGTPAPTLKRITDLIEADNQLAANKPAFIPPGASQPPNPLSTEARAPSAPSNPLNNPKPTPVVEEPKATIPSGLTPQEAAEYEAIPEKLPPAPKIPPVTQAQAEARADQLIQHFAARKGAPADQDLVPGFVPTLAQKTNDPGIATLERGVQSANPGALDLRKEANQRAVQEFTAKLVGTPEDIAAAQAERERLTAPMRDAAFANKTDVSGSPIEQQIDGILAGPDGKRAAVRKTLQDVKASLHVGQDLDKPLETDPEQLYGVRKHINDLLSPAAQRDNPELQRAASALQTIKDHLDDVIEEGAPGFKDYVAKYADLSRPIDEKQYLQGLNLTDQAGNVRGASVDAALKTIAKLQRAPGANKADSISDETIDALQRLHRTLQVARFSDTAGKALGSNTFQNLATNSTVGAVTGNPLIHLGMTGVGSLVGGVPGAMMGAGIDMAARGITNNAESMVRRAMIERLLNLQGKGEAALRGGAATQ